VALVGFSFGADVMPFLYDRLDEQWRKRIDLISLLSPFTAADWEIEVAGWFGAGPSSAATPLAPALGPIPGDRVQCFYGNQEKGNSCALFAAKGADLFEKEGEHHLDGDYDLIARQIFEGFKQRTAGP
jgi:type IV secretory pathway VirJ component